jgi:predicted nucleic acid-binding protein
MIFVDSNIPMYLVGADHPNKPIARQLVERAIMAGDRLVTSAEVLQEILHRYAAIGRRDAIAAAFAAILDVVDDVLPIERGEVERARRLLETAPRLSARDALHVAIMQRHEIDRVMSFDAGFDGIPGIERLTN